MELLVGAWRAIQCLWVHAILLPACSLICPDSGSLALNLHMPILIWLGVKCLPAYEGLRRSYISSDFETTGKPKEVSRKERVESMVPDWSTERGEGTSRLSLSTPKDILRSREKVTLEEEDGEKQRAWSDMVQKPLNQTRHEPRGKILCR
ncbi:hypothetical protein F2Q70_00032793 [Brassica cretica]|uniref:Uncharacterized protein n=1 Tax=Brassica cretica TaxID=69181 RepID=A0A8S9FDW7_BRACR|nr:hypothetical protein F2Q70_00032793 [Brassica cretica]